METPTLVFDCIVIKDEGAFVSLCLDIDVASQGSTVEEAKANLIEAVSLHVECVIESNLPLLRPVPQSDNPVIQDPSSVVEQFKMNIDVHVSAHA